MELCWNKKLWRSLHFNWYSLAGTIKCCVLCNCLKLGTKKKSLRNLYIYKMSWILIFLVDRQYSMSKIIDIQIILNHIKKEKNMLNFTYALVIFGMNYLFINLKEENFHYLSFRRITVFFSRNSNWSIIYRDSRKNTVSGENNENFHIYWYHVPIAIPTETRCEHNIENIIP